MTLRDNRLFSSKLMEQEIESLERVIKKKRALHDDLSQELLDVVMKKDGGMDQIQIIHKSEKIQQEIRENLTDIRHLDKKIAKMKHRANRMKHIN